MLIDENKKLISRTIFIDLNFIAESIGFKIIFKTDINWIN